MFKKAIVFISLLISFVSYSQKRAKKPIIKPSTNKHLFFSQNLGQWEEKINFLSRLNCGNIFFEKSCLTYFIYDNEKYKDFHLGGIGKYKDISIKAHAFKVDFINCNINSKCLGEKKLNFYENYYLGKDQSKWKSNVPVYEKITYTDLYEGIDFEAFANEEEMKYTYYVKPKADFSKIKFKYNGVDNIKINDNGEIVIKTSFCDVIEKKPYAYQNINGNKIIVPCKYKLHNDVITFEITENYNRNFELVIDPVLVFAAQSGSTADNFGMTATYDIQGNLYAGGTVFDIGYPYITGSYSNVFNGPVASGNTDVVVSKYNPSGTSMLYSTYFGGSGSEIVTSLIVDGSNNLFLYGATGSNNFPMTLNTYDNSFNGGNYLDFLFNGTTFSNGTDIYVSKFNSTGSVLLASTYIGGSDNDGVNYTNGLPTYTVSVSDWYVPIGSPPGTACLFGGGVYTLTEHKADSLQYNYGDQYRGEIQLDKFGNVYISSSTRSSNFPFLNGFDNSLNGLQDAIVFKFNSTLTNLQWSNFVGGNGNDAGYSLIVTDSLFTYATGGTYSTDFPTVAGCYQTSFNGGKADGYIVKINPTGNTLIKSTYLGTNDYDQSYFIQKDKNNKIYVFGQSLGNMPVVGSVYSNPGSHQFITQLDGQLHNVTLGTVFGSGLPKVDISPSAFSVDNCGNIYISGWGGNIIYGPSTSGMPVTSNGVYTTSPNGYDFYLMALSPNASGLLYGSYFGGACSKEHVDGGTSRFDPAGKIYQSVCAGCGNNDDFPVTAGAWPNTPPNPNHSNNCNNGVFKFDFQLQVTVSTINTNTITGCSPLAVSFTNATPGTSYMWYLGNGVTTSVVPNPSTTYTNPGTYTVSLVVLNTSSAVCNSKDSAVTFITVFPKPTTNFTLTTTPCTNSITTVNTSTGSLGSNPYNWNFGNGVTSTVTAPSYTYPAAGNYTVSLTTTDVNGCTDIKTNTVSIFNFFPGVTNGAVICQGFTTNLTASGGTSYTWTPSTFLSGTNIASPNLTPTVTTIYTVQIDNNSPGNFCSRTLTTQVTVFPKPNADFTYTTNPCGGGVNFFDLSGPTIASWQWTLSSSATSTVQNPYYFYYNGAPTGTNVTLIVTDNNGCKDTVNKIITVLIPPPISINPTKLICKGDKAVLLANGGISYQWTPTVSLDITNIPGPTATPGANTQYSCVITTSNSCSFLLTTDVNITQISTTPISANANPINIVQGNSSNLTYIGDLGAIVNWSPANSVSPSTGYSVIAHPDRSTTYTVTIKNGPCKETLTVYVEVNLSGCLDSDVFIPNTFTPNGDGNNDILYVRGLKVNEVYFAVYNRWGELVWETNDVTKGWDGIYKGKPADVGVFGWYLKVKCFDGNETFKKGNVTLIR